jgi:phosphoenolpyruvate carboxykinase (ATP)
MVNPETREVDYADDSITENTRAAYPLDYIANAVESGMASHPRYIIFLAADAFGILPPVARLTETQAMYHFLSGYTARLAGTEAGMGREPQATFSTCFGAPFLPLPPRVYADMLAKKMREHKCRCYLVNTGWVGGPAGAVPRIPLRYNRVSIDEILSGRLDHAPMVIDPTFGFEVPKQCGDIPSDQFKLRETWKNPAEYDAKARDLAQRFVKNFEQYLAHAPDIAAGGPKL